MIRYGGESDADDTDRKLWSLDVPVSPPASVASST